LARSYAIGLIPDTRPAVENDGDGYESDTEKDMVSEEIEELEEDDDNSAGESETPKKKKKGVKPKVRDLIKARRDDLAISKAQKGMEVSVTLLESRLPHVLTCLIRFVKLSLPRAFVVLMPDLSYLILNESTLFYFDLSHSASASNISKTGKIETWTDQVAKANKKSKVRYPTATGSSTTAVRTDRNTTSSHAIVTLAVPTTKKKAEPKLEAVNSSVSVFLDEPEDESAEREAALTSPIKGKKRLTTKVRCNS
jgi:hypothetical protein